MLSFIFIVSSEEFFLVCSIHLAKQLYMKTVWHSRNHISKQAESNQNVSPIKSKLMGVGQRYKNSQENFYVV